jgi:hypothetical protein
MPSTTNPPSVPSDDLDHFYELLDDLRRRVGGERRLASCSSRSGWPERGVYFFFEPGEVRPDGTLRVVRVGTHALTLTSRTTLWHRLSQHRGQDGGRWAGGGNHRGSIFRHHVGEALFASEPDAGAESTWALRNPAPPNARDLERRHEVHVSDYIRALPFLWVGVDDPPGPASDRHTIEAASIGLLSCIANPRADRPSPRWLGSAARRDAIRMSGLWNVRHVGEPYDPGFQDTLYRWVRAMGPSH